MSGRRERTPEEREAARVARERKRTGGPGRAKRVPEPPSAASAPGPSPRAAQPAPPSAEVSSSTPRPRPSVPPVAQPVAPTRKPAVAPPSFNPLPSAAVAAVADSPSEEHEATAPDPPAPMHGDEAPAGTRRVSALHRRASAPHAGRPARAARSSGAGGRRMLRAGRIAATMAIVLASALLWFLAQLFQPFHGNAGARLRVVIPAHLSSGQVGDLLVRDGVISSSFFFELRASLAGERGSLRSGTYELRHGMSYGDALKVLTTVPPAAPVTGLTVIEGQTRRGLDRLLHSQGIHGSYLQETRNSRLLDPSSYGAPRQTASLEGFLFPDTYELQEPISGRALVADQLKNFRQQFAGLHLPTAATRALTPYQVLIIASIIQGEARTLRDRALVSSVIFNRLRAGMPLQMDDTVRYATGNYLGPITVSELASTSPWNTYTHRGLPPTPIDSPGIDSLRAAAHPAATPYLFFVVKPCGNGSHAFAATYAQFLTLQNRYNSARAQRGGRSPEFCR